MKLTIHDKSTGDLYSLSLTQTQIDAYEGKPDADLKNHPDIRYEMEGLGIHPMNADVRLIKQVILSTHTGQPATSFISKTRNL